MTGNSRLLRIASGQYGIFTHAQALACGVASSTLSRHADGGRYRRVHHRVYAVGGSPPTWHGDVLAAVLSSHHLTAASHQTAAYLWGLTDRLPREIEIVTVRHLRPITAVRVHESLDLRSSDVVEVDGIPVTSAVRTVVDLGASAPGWLVERCLDTGIRKKLFTAVDVRRFVARVGRSGRSGVGVIRPFVEERLEWQGVTESDAADLFRIVVREGGLAMPSTQYVLRDGNGEFIMRSDFAYEESMALFEIDSEKHHMDPETFRRDREKQNRAHQLGWTVYRFTWRQLVDDPASVVSVLACLSPNSGPETRKKPGEGEPPSRGLSGLGG